jgi:hypothetical protein
MSANSYKELEYHIGHYIQCIRGYKDTVGLKCLDCDETLVSFGNKTLLRDVLPDEFFGGEYCDTPAHMLKNEEVVAVLDGTSCGHFWIGTHKNVMHWWILKNGMAVGWNENPSRGWSFPVMKLPASHLCLIGTFDK